MAVDVCLVEARYLDSCKGQGLLPNSSILSGFSKAKLRKSCHELCNLEVFLDQLKDADFLPLIDVLMEIDSSEIQAVDLLHVPSRVLCNGEYILSLIHAVNQKLRVVDLQDLSFGKDFLWDISQRGLTCQVLNLRCSHIRKLNMTGKFMQLHTLNLDFSMSLTSFQEDCFRCMPNLIRLSMCGTRFANLWMTIAALSKLPSLLELRFQNCLCCINTGPCSTSFGGKGKSFAHEKISSHQQQFYPYDGSPSILNEGLIFQNSQYSSTEEIFANVFSDDDSFENHDMLQSTTESSDESKVGFSRQGTDSWMEILSNNLLELSDWTNPENVADTTGRTITSSGNSSLPMEFYDELILSQSNSTGLQNDTHEINISDDLGEKGVYGYVAPDKFSSQIKRGIQFSSSTVSIPDKEGYSKNEPKLGHTLASSDAAPRKYISHHPSPICFEKHYREYMLASLPQLKVLDNLPVKNADREKAKMVFSEYYEYLPYNRQYKESVVSLLQKREMGSRTGLQKPLKLKRLYSSEKSHHSFSRSISAAKVGASAWPLLHPVSKFGILSREETKSFRPRQFEYNPSNPSLMVFGTLDGELVVINHESGRLVGYLPSVAISNSILGLSWLKKYPSKLIAGSDNGSLLLYDVCKMPSIVTDRYHSADAATFTFDEFEQLTSVHINSTDELFLSSGYSKHVALYDIGSGKRLQIFKDLHREHINVVKFAHHSPSIFATSSFDKEVKMWELRQRPLQPCYTVSSSRGNVMVCFSPDDQYLLSSAVDNEVKQFLAVDGRLHMKFSIASMGSAQNYTRSYYMNGRDYIISGSCEENVVRICCAQTGRRLRDISFEGRGSRNALFVQSLRGDPFQVFHFSVLAAYLRPSSKSEIIKINLLASNDDTKDNSHGRHCHPSYSRGG